MAQEKQLQENNISQLSKGLHTDNSQVDSPKGTYRFALNSVNETELGDFGFISNEESNEECASLTPGYVPIGKCYIGNNETVILSVSSDNTVSEIGILDNNCNYVVHVNDATSPDKEKLGFKVERQIQVTYRLRRGCERTIYFAGKNYPVRYFNFDKPEQFKKNGHWSSPKFGLYKKLKKFPTIDNVEILDGSGNLVPGSYTVLVQHLDEDLNGTEFYELIKDIIIYNDSLKKNFADIDGSSNIGTDETGPYKYSKTTKAIKIALDAVDKNFTYIRFAFVERTSGNGQVSGVKYSDLISVNSPIYTYTGDNAKQNGTIEEVELFNMNSGIQSAEHIEQIDNMLILANVKGEQAKICKLQKYASKIKTDCFVKDVILTSVKDEHNPKNPLVVHNGLGYQPGDIYSLGIQYIFEDYSTSPVFHIPGKSPRVAKDIVFSPEAGVYPMSNINNQNESEVYLDENTSCSSQTYWGYDSEGTLLRGQNVRHHRFPTRDEIGIGFVDRKETNSDVASFKQIVLNLLGAIKKSNSTATPPYVAPNFTLKVKYKRNGIEESFQDSIFPDSSVTIRTIQSNIFQNSDTITDIKLYYIKEDSTTETEVVLTNNESEVQSNDLTYKISIGSITENNTKHIYQAPILGLKFSNIDIPNESEIGKKVIGYQIVRQKRTEGDKNILDSAVVFPMLKSGRNASVGLLAPEYFYSADNMNDVSCEGSEDGTYPTCYNISKRNIMLLTPGHKFMNKTYDGFTTIEQVGNYQSEYVARSASSTQNIYEGTSASGDEDKKTNDDDGYTLRHGYRFTGVKYNKIQGTPFKVTNDNTRMYNLEAVNYSESEDNKETLYNLSCDNKSLILSSNQDGADLRTYRPGKHQFPYVYIKKDNSTFYQNFRSNPYYLVDTQVFTSSTCKVFGGDTYIAPMRYSNHIFGNGVAALRRKKMSAWALIGSIVVALIGAALAIFSGGSSLILAAGIIVALGAVATGAATIIETKRFTEIYGDKWQANIDRTVFDFIYARLFIREHPDQDQPSYNPDKHYQPWADDTFRWFGDIVGDLWFETTLNISLRVPPTNMENNYLSPLKTYMDDNTSKLFEISQTEYISNNTIGSGRFRRYIDPGTGYEPVDPHEWFFFKKITKTDSSKSSGYSYTGISIPQIYLVNPDHYVTTGIKKFYTIPLEYDCCSECTESYPHRIHYSQQSFQEEKSDNYRMFLPNNYRDIEGETGEITNVFRLYNNLFAHTKEALWKMGRNYQERVTDNVVSFIGTGSYFEIPPQKLIDDETGSSAGTQHKWSSIKTPAGYFFVSENQRKIYQFDGQKINPISNIGISNWFENNIQIQLDKEFYNEKGYSYPNKDNPSNKIGTGFISTYDTKKERIIFTKKDVKLDTNIYGEDTQICTNGDSVTIFPNFSNTISLQAAAGWYFEGVENCKLKFSKQIIKTRMEPREVTTTIPNNADIIVHLDMSGSFNPTTRTQIKNAVGQWLSTYNASNPNWTGRVFFSEQDGYTSQRCWRVLRFIKDGLNIKDISGNSVSANTISKNIVAVSFVNENLIGGYGSNICYHPELTNPMGMYASDFIDDYTDFKNLYNQHIASGGTFHALNYPINYSTEISNMTQGFMQHVLAVLKGVSYTQAEVDALIPNPFMSADAWNTLKASLVGNNIYPDDGLENYGWKGITNRGWNGSGDVITPAQFQVDMNQFLQGITTTTIVMTKVEYLDTEYNYIDGQVIQNPIQLDNSWTISYSLKGENWVSWHSYIPNFYVNVPEKFYSWKHGSNKLWRHNKLGHFQTYYGTYKPHIIEYTSSSNPVTTRIWNHIMLQTEAKTYNYDLRQYHDERYVTFNKAILYNSRQCSGEMDLVVKDEELGGQDYMMNQVINTNVNQSIIDRNERDWLINDFRDIRIDYTKPIWNSNISSLQSEYFIDKILNTSTLDINKDWTQLESFRDKYLVVRLIFDKFANKKLITNFSVENEQQSFY